MNRRIGKVVADGEGPGSRIGLHPYWMQTYLLSPRTSTNLQFQVRPWRVRT